LCELGSIEGTARPYQDKLGQLLEVKIQLSKPNSGSLGNLRKGSGLSYDAIIHGIWVGEAVKMPHAFPRMKYESQTSNYDR
jgi:hypothetical protein